MSPSISTRRLMSALALLAAVGGVQAQDRAEVAPSQIIGNRELPKVLYIVPWKKPTPDPLVGKPQVSVLDEVLAPVDRDVFRRQLQYGSAAAAPTTTAAAIPPAAPMTAAPAPKP